MWKNKYYLVHQIILLSANLHCHFHILFMYYSLYFPTFIFVLYVPCFLFLNQSQSEAGDVNQMSHLSFWRGSNIGQLNVQTAMVEKENLYTLSNIIYIKF